MAFKDFADTQYVKTIDTGEAPEMGTFQPAKNAELAHVRVLIYIQDVTALGGSEQIQCKIYSDPNFAALQYTSSLTSLSGITNIGTTNWLGFIRIDFNRENLNKNITYYPRVNLTNYTRSANAFFIGLSRDYPFPIYDNSQNFFYRHPLAMQWFWFIDRANQ